LRLHSGIQDIEREPIHCVQGIADDMMAGSNGAVGFIDWLNGLVMLRAFPTGQFAGKSYRKQKSQDDASDGCH